MLIEAKPKWNLFTENPVKRSPKEPFRQRYPPNQKNNCDFLFNTL